MGSRSNDDLRQLAVNWDGAVPNVQIVQPLRSDQAVRLDSSWFNVQWKTNWTGLELHI